MLAVLGFTVAGILFIAYSLSLPKVSGKKFQQLLKDYSNAYLMLAAAFVIFGVASAINDPDVLAMSVIFGDLFILGGTALVMGILYRQNKYRQLIVMGTIVAGGILLIIRVLYFMPEPYIQDSILVFNSRRLVSFMLAAIFLLVWLPVNMQMSRMLTARIPHADNFARQHIFMIMAATFAASMFVLAKKPNALVISFTALCIAFLVLTITNFALRSLGGQKHGK